MKNELICVDENDKEIGFGEKMAVHKKGQLHRAFSVFVYSNEDHRFLLQQRSLNKYHSGGKWSNSFCSHPYKNESWYSSLQRAAKDELNISLEISKNIQCEGKMQPNFIDDKLYFAGSFIYFSDYYDLSEHEYDYVFIYFLDSLIPNVFLNKDEVSNLCWKTKEEIREWIKESPDDFSTWFKKAFKLVENYFGR